MALPPHAAIHVFVAAAHELETNPSSFARATQMIHANLDAGRRYAAATVVWHWRNTHESEATETALVIVAAADPAAGRPRHTVTYWEADDGEFCYFPREGATERFQVANRWFLTAGAAWRRLWTSIGGADAIEPVVRPGVASLVDALSERRRYAGALVDVLRPLVACLCARAGTDRADLAAWAIADRIAAGAWTPTEARAARCFHRNVQIDRRFSVRADGNTGAAAVEWFWHVYLARDAGTAARACTGEAAIDDGSDGYDPPRPAWFPGTLRTALRIREAVGGALDAMGLGSDLAILRRPAGVSVVVVTPPSAALRGWIRRPRGVQTRRVSTGDGRARRQQHPIHRLRHDGGRQAMEGTLVSVPAGRQHQRRPAHQHGDPHHVGAGAGSPPPPYDRRGDPLPTEARSQRRRALPCEEAAVHVDRAVLG
jgi:hypothetical protein